VQLNNAGTTSAGYSQPFNGQTLKGAAMNFAIEQLKIDGPLLIRSKRFDDLRGHFMETWSRDAFRHLGVDVNFVQDNQSLSARQGTVRGLHFQLPPFAQAKLVRVLQGSVFDVAVDLRRGSPHYGGWCGTMLTAAKPEQLYVPKGFAHGFVTLEPETVVAYKVDASYAPHCDAGIHWQDPDIGIEWPFDTTGAVLSSKDSSLPPFAAFSSPFLWEEGYVVESPSRPAVPA
jgi:dTDP-4-dehydrorhamnose 3,5-epimerase